MKIYTKTGDRGETSLLSGQRVPKDHIRVDTYGTMDEAGAALGLAKALTINERAAAIIERLQTEIVALNADLATEDCTGGGRITTVHVAALEATIDSLTQEIIPCQGFVIPGACPAGAALDLSRTIVRRAERNAVALHRISTLPSCVLKYLNRLSDLLFVLARYVEQEELVTSVTSRTIRELNKINDMSRGGRKTMLEKAKNLINAAERKAAEIGVPMVITVVDDGGNLVAQHRMDGALLASIAISRDKAYTAVALKMPTHQAAALAQPGQPLFGLNTIDGGRLVIFGGGLPIIDNGKIVGGIGVSGGTVDEDIAVAQAALAAW
ncbi:cob(I)yrinic acid a,c-diamide adenosyltransferase [Sporolituus thermophilus]|uniref:Corrinoid adenosyltransferase n=1 Tax=Sporolituus thermophilus DSM 23256 TaxID=1123285 RepID=A0A1G7M4I9_9FIRM|nr:cob(I)yrinic acid a,c-diamide adenosyltransferase [Sporolituus thermophilus]SDF56554.1 ATP:cob(I)alamin adenosyltransferase [Sporolituus thermophilus DSM 23256]